MRKIWVVALLFLTGCGGGEVLLIPPKPRAYEVDEMREWCIETYLEGRPDAKDQAIKECTWLYPVSSD